jgi:hypothetical protein
MGWCWGSREGSLVGRVVGLGMGAITGTGGRLGGSITGAGIGGGAAMCFVGERRVQPERRTRGVTADRRVRMVGIWRVCCMAVG